MDNELSWARFALFKLVMQSSLTLNWTLHFVHCRHRFNRYFKFLYLVVSWTLRYLIWSSMFINHLFQDKIDLSTYRKPTWTDTVTSSVFSENEYCNGNSPWHYSLMRLQLFKLHYTERAVIRAFDYDIFC